MNSVARPVYSLEQVMRILDLASDYLSVANEAKEKLTATLQKQFEDGGEINITEAFVRENLASEDEIEQLKPFDAHLRTLCLDQQFGKIVVANGFATQDSVAQALKDQRDNKYRINTKIGGWIWKKPCMILKLRSKWLRGLVNSSNTEFRTTALKRLSKRKQILKMFPCMNF